MWKAASFRGRRGAVMAAVASLLAVVAGATEPAVHSATTGLVAAYSFDQSGSTVTDLSGNGNNGSVSNATWTSVSGSMWLPPMTARACSCG